MLHIFHHREPSHSVGPPLIERMSTRGGERGADRLRGTRSSTKREARLRRVPWIIVLGSECAAEWVVDNSTMAFRKGAQQLTELTTGEDVALYVSRNAFRRPLVG